jgi:glucosamine--fructose-6-phosphate aminotransferase (isomerizing)
MCGIVGYIGEKPADYVILNALKKLEYRGYDSAGISLLTENGNIFTKKEKGKIVNLENLLFQNRKSVFSICGIGHTRWATHGEPSKVNAHPHKDCSGDISVVHNGIIENYSQLKRELTEKGHTFTSNTDTEVIPHILEDCLKETDDILEAVEKTVSKLEGAYALAIILKRKEPVIIGIRKGSPLVMGVGEGEYFLASDIPAFLEYTNNVIFLDDDEIVIINKESFDIYCKGEKTDKKISKIKWDAIQAKKGGYKHYMLKEINEQPEAVKNTILDKVNFSEYSINFEDFDNEIDDFLISASAITITACGTSWHAGLIGKFLIESLTDITVEVDYASELRYRDKIINENSMLIAVSQSGETADTLEVIRRFKRENAKILSICNVLGSSIPRESHYTVYTHAGPEISVASTKAFTTQVTVFLLLALYIARKRGLIEQESFKELIEELKNLPDIVDKTVQSVKNISEVAPVLAKYPNYLYLGRGINYPVALEGALKLKEISYIHAEGYPGGEMKHGPLALIDENFPSVILLPKDSLYDKMFGNLNEIKSRKGTVVLFTSESNNDENLKDYADYIFKIPNCNRFFQPIIYVIPLQLLSYHIADFKGCDIDQPRNLAKSVTVE